MTDATGSINRHGLGRRIWRARWAYAFVLAPTLLFVVFEFYPFLQATIYSVSAWTLRGPGAFVGLDNYFAIFRDRIFFKALTNTIAYAFFVVVGSVGLSLVIAAAIYPLASRAKAFFKIAFYLPAVASIVVVALVWRWMYQPAFGLFNHLASIVGLGPFGFLTDTSQSLASIMIMQIFSNPTIGIGASIILVLAAMNSIPSHLYEAAMLDGAGAVQRFRRLTIPLLRPTILFLFIIGTVEAFREFTAIYLMTSASSGQALTGGGPYYSTTTLAYYTYVQAFLARQVGLASAMAMVLLAIVFVVALIQFRRFNTEIEY